jgi:hypothetical protein
VFDLLINAEVFVDDVAVAERVFVDALGFPEPRPTWSGQEPGFGFTWLFARVHPSLKVSPTRVEAMAVAPVDPSVDARLTITFLPQLLAAQGDRPWKTHANELATSDIGGVEARLERNGCRYYSMPRDELLPFTRLWLGWTAADPGRYRPDDDGGLFLEICETAGLTQSPDFFEPGPEPDLPPGAFVRVVRRSWLVNDLDATVAALDRNFGLHSVAGIERDEHLGCLQALFRFTHPHSAELEVLEPVAAGAAKESLDAWGPGSWAIRIGVNDLAAKAEDLRHRGTGFERHSHPVHGPSLLVDTGSMDVPGLFEFAEI